MAERQTYTIPEIRRLCDQWGELHQSGHSYSRSANSALSKADPYEFRRTVKHDLNITGMTWITVMIRRKSHPDVQLTLSGSDVKRLKSGRVIQNGRCQVKYFDGYLYVRSIQKVTAEGKERKATSGIVNSDWPPVIVRIDQIMCRMPKRCKKALRYRHLYRDMAQEDRVSRISGALRQRITATKFKEFCREGYAIIEYELMKLTD